MNTVIQDTTAIRLNKDLLNTLQERAKASNISLNSFIEGILFEAVYNEPNQETLQAMAEVRNNSTELECFSDVGSLMAHLQAE